jgi:hypothetical protein
VINDPLIVQSAIRRLTEATGWKVIKKENRLILMAERGTYGWNLIIRKGLRNIHLPTLEKEMADQQPSLLVTDHLLPGLRERLRINGFSYLDDTGNIFLKERGLLILIEVRGREKPEFQVKPENRAFTKTGLPLVFGILQNPDELEQTRRELAESYGMAVGNVHNVLEGLQQGGYLIGTGTTRNKQYRLIDTKRLLNAWIMAYGEQLKPDLYVGGFRFLKEEGPDSWKTLSFRNDQTVWGGEPAADLLTHYLRPAELTIYTEEESRRLVKTYRLVPDEIGKVKVYRKFWHHEDKETQGVAPILLVYADLLLTGDPRCAETAQKIYDEYLSEKF